MITESIALCTTIHFPDGTWNQGQLSNQMRVGEKVIFEGEETVYIVKDIQHQFRGNHEGLIVHRMINVILGFFEDQERKVETEHRG